jgi:hypothetical protein
VSVERVRIESFALAANPATSSEFLKTLFATDAQNASADQEETWATPESAEDIEQFLSGF